MIPPRSNRSVASGGVQASASFEISVKDSARRYILENEVHLAAAAVWHRRQRLTPDERVRRRRARAKAWKDSHPEQVKAYRRDRYYQDVEAARARARAWYYNNREYQLTVSAERQLARFGLTLDDYVEILRGQKNVCAICEQAPVEGARRLAVDHNPATGEIRGALCIRCNVGLGHFQEDPNLLIAATEYLRRPPTRFSIPKKGPAQ